MFRTTLNRISFKSRFEFLNLQCIPKRRISVSELEKFVGTENKKHFADNARASVLGTLSKTPNVAPNGNAILSVKTTGTNSLGSTITATHDIVLFSHAQITRLAGMLDEGIKNIRVLAEGSLQYEKIRNKEGKGIGDRAKIFPKFVYFTDSVKADSNPIDFNQVILRGQLATEPRPFNDLTFLSLTTQYFDAKENRVRLYNHDILVKNPNLQEIARQLQPKDLVAVIGALEYSFKEHGDGKRAIKQSKIVANIIFRA